MFKSSITALFIDDVMRPLARILIRLGSPAQELADVSRWSFVKAFYETPDFWRHNKPTVQQGALKTGLPRPEVDRLNRIKTPDNTGRTQRMNDAVRVLSGWVHDATFHVGDPPWQLPVLNPRGPSFRRLVGKYGRDASPNAVLDDLVKAGCVAVDDGVTRLISQAYGLSIQHEERLYWVGRMARYLLLTTGHNLLYAKEDRLLQRMWWQRSIPSDKAEAALAYINAICIEAGRKIDGYLAAIADNPTRQGVQYEAIGIAMYAFRETKTEDATTDEGEPK